MAEKSKKSSPPYATYGSFTSFLNKLRETGIPNRIDPTVFGNASGSISYSVIATLKYLKLIDEDGRPASEFTALVNAADEARKPILKRILESGYPTLFGEDFSLATTSAGHFNDHIRDEFEVNGSTIDKIAIFFIAAASDAGIAISQHLKDRKPIAQSSSSKKSVKQRAKSENGDIQIPPTKTPPESAKGDVGKPLHYQLIDLMTEPDFPENIKAPIWELVQYLTTRRAKKSTAETDAVEG